MPHLVFFRRDEKLMEYRLQGGRTTLGRADSCDISLPGDEISRNHCVVSGHGQRWTLSDRSRHGTTVNEALVRRAALQDGDRIGIGAYQVIFSAGERESMSTAEAVPARLHEQLLEASERALHIRQAALTITEGLGAGQTFRLRRARVTVGTQGSGIVLDDPTVTADHCRLRVSRGRVMLEPGRGVVWLDGQRLREITPLYPDESFRLGETTLRLSVGEAELQPEAQRFGDMQGSSTAMRRLFGTLRVLAGHDEPVLVMGESGTGKELTARGLHEHSPRSAGPFIPLNCGGLPQHLLQSELFGYEKGAFTGATERRDGAFQQADGGTLFLDELGELPLEAQATLLRVLGGGGVRRVGGFTVEHPDVRVIAATNRDLVEMVQAGTFREDLFFRLETLFVELPPLRSRREDIALLAERFARRFNPEASIAPDAMAALVDHSWPGNVRELQNVIRRAATFSGTTRIEARDVTFHTIRFSRAPSAPRASSPGPQLDRGELQVLLARHGGNRSAAARDIGMSRSTFLYRLKKAGLG